MQMTEVIPIPHTIQVQPCGSSMVNEGHYDPIIEHEEYVEPRVLEMDEKDLIIFENVRREAKEVMERGEHILRGADPAEYRSILDEIRPLLKTLQEIIPYCDCDGDCDGDCAPTPLAGSEELFTELLRCGGDLCIKYNTILAPQNNLNLLPGF
jgi:hypothetical protein